MTKDLPDDPMNTTEDVLRRLPYSHKLKYLASLRQLPSAPRSLEESLGRETPQEFILGVLGEKPTLAALRHKLTKPWTPDQELILNSVVNHRRTAVHSGHSVGKTAILARIALWFLYRYEGSIVITTAPTKRQVEELLWGEIRSCFQKSQTKLAGRVLRTKIEIAERWQAIGFTATTGTGDLSATAFQGFHAPRVMILLDEAVAIDESILAGAEGIAVGPEDRIVAIANPTDVGSWFYKACKNWESVIQLDGLNHPNVIFDDPQIIPGAVSKIWVQDRLLEWGEKSPLYLSKVRGVWPEESPDTLISLAWIEKAKAKYEEWVSGGAPDALRGHGVAAGLDIASAGEDLTVFSVVEDGCWKIPSLGGKPSWHVGKDPTFAVELILSAFKCGLHIRILALDDTGLGASVTGMILKKQREGELPKFAIVGKHSRESPWVIPVNFGANAFTPHKFLDTKSELWWNLREALREGNLALPPDHVMDLYKLPRGNSLDTQISKPIYDLEGKGRIRVYDKRGAHGEAGKEKTKNLPADSPDVAHSCILANWAWKMVVGHGEIEPEAKDEGNSVDKWWTAKVRAMMGRKKDTNAGKSPWVR